MSKQLALACFYVGKGYGMNCYQFDLEDDTSHQDDLVIARSLVSWSTYAVELVELAHSITMEYPEGHEHTIYGAFGGWFGDYCAENGDDGEYPPPDADDCKSQLVELVMDEFSSMNNDNQNMRLRALLEAVEP